MNAVSSGAVRDEEIIVTIAIGVRAQAGIRGRGRATASTAEAGNRTYRRADDGTAGDDLLTMQARGSY